MNMHDFDMKVTGLHSKNRFLRYGLMLAIETEEKEIAHCEWTLPEGYKQEAVSEHTNRIKHLKHIYNLCFNPKLDL